MKLSKLNKKYLGLFAVGTTLLLSYQNCGKAGFDSALDSSTLGVVDKAVANSTFAYDVSIDQIAFNSCAGTNLQGMPGMNTISFGAYGSSAGLSIRSDFISYAKSNLRPIYPDSVISKKQIKNLIADSPANSGYQLQAIIRRGSQLSNLFTHNTKTVGIDYAYLLGDLADDRWMNTVVPETDGIENYVATPSNFFPAAPTFDSRVLEGALSFNEDYSVTNSLKSYMINENFILALGFGKQKGQIEDLAGMSSDGTSAHGRGFQFSLGTFPSGNYGAGVIGIGRTSNPKSILQGVREINLENAATGSVTDEKSWTCDSRLIIPIIKSADAATKCPSMSPGVLDNPSLKTQYVTIRRSLKAEFWDVNYVSSAAGNYWCAVHKSGSCYDHPDDEKFGSYEIPVEYDVSQICYEKHFSGDTDLKNKLNLKYYVDSNGNNVLFYSLNGTMYWVKNDGTSTGQHLPVKQCLQTVSICTRN